MRPKSAYFPASDLENTPANPTARPRAHFLKPAIKMPFCRLFPPTGCMPLARQPLPALRSVSCIFRSAITDSCLQTPQQHKIPQAQKGGSAPPGLTTGETLQLPCPATLFPAARPSNLFDTARISKVKAPTPAGCAGRVPALTLPLRAGQAGASTGGSAGERFSGQSILP